MDNPQYLIKGIDNAYLIKRFKPYYKWITLNTAGLMEIRSYEDSRVLNLIING